MTFIRDCIWWRVLCPWKRNMCWIFWVVMYHIFLDIKPQRKKHLSAEIRWNWTIIIIQFMFITLMLLCLSYQNFNNYANMINTHNFYWIWLTYLMYLLVVIFYWYICYGPCTFISCMYYPTSICYWCIHGI